MEQICRAIPVMPVRDIESACTWYARALGLTIVTKHEGQHAGEATNYAVLVRDGVQIHLILDEPAPYRGSWTLHGSGYLYLQVKDVEKLHTAVQAARLPLTSELGMSSWGANGFEFRDPSGNLIRVEQAPDGR